MPVYSGTVGSSGGNYDGTFDGHGPEAWTDINPNSFFKDPNVLIPAADVTRFKEDQDEWDLYKRPRDVIYTEVHNSITYKYKLSLVFLVMPAAASTVVLSSAVGTYETVGKILGNDGVLTAATDTAKSAAGVSLGKYFSVGVDTFGEAAVGPYAKTSLASDAFTVGNLTAGDGIWVIRSGRCCVDPAVTVAAGDQLSFAAAGEVTNVFPITADGADTAHTTEAEKKVLANELHQLYLGTALSSGSTSLLALADVRMPERYGDDIEGSGVVDASPAA